MLCPGEAGGKNRYIPVCKGGREEQGGNKGFDETHPRGVGRSQKKKRKEAKEKRWV